MIVIPMTLRLEAMSIVDRLLDDATGRFLARDGRRLTCNPHAEPRQIKTAATRGGAR